MNYENILVQQENGIATITINRPKKLNALNRDTIQELHDAFEALNAAADANVIILTGGGEKAFVAGADISEFAHFSVEDGGKLAAKGQELLFDFVENLATPVIAAVNGVAAGAGANIALACDLTIAQENASFIQAFSKIGLIPDSGGTYFLPRIIGVQKALALMFTGDKISAKEAEELNMIYKCISEEEFEDFILKIAEKMALMPTRAFGLTKKAVNQSLDNTLEEQLNLEEKLQTEAGKTEDFQEGVQAFLEKRKAKFKGK